ncbi:hypothetical protein NUSPORA_00946 [Nucleospora cyclopteri]
MGKLELFYDSQEKYSVYINLNIERLKEPLTIKRAEKELFDEENVVSKAKSEIIDYEDEKYKKLKEQEEQPYIIEDAEGRCFKGKLQETASTSAYYAFIRENNKIRVVEIDKWYNFSVKAATLSKEATAECFEKKFKTYDIENDSKEDEHEADFEQRFDDDDQEETEIIYEEKEKDLSESGYKLQHLMEELEKGSTQSLKEFVPTQDEPKESSKKVKKTLTEKDLQKIFGNKKLTVKDLLKSLAKSDFHMETEEKNTIRLFLQKNCRFETDKKSKDKLFSLK